MTPQAHRRSFDLMDAIAIALWLISAAVIVGVIWLALSLLLGLHGYVESTGIIR